MSQVETLNPWKPLDVNVTNAKDEVSLENEFIFQQMVNWFTYSTIFGCTFFTIFSASRPFFTSTRSLFLLAILWLPVKNAKIFFATRLLLNEIQKILHLHTEMRTHVTSFNPSSYARDKKMPFIFMTTWKLVLCRLFPSYLQKSWKEKKIIENKNEATKAGPLRKPLFYFYFPATCTK